jgi:hypothetical protein
LGGAPTTMFLAIVKLSSLSGLGAKLASRPLALRS